MKYHFFLLYFSFGWFFKDPDWPKSLLNLEKSGSGSVDTKKSKTKVQVDKILFPDWIQIFGRSGSRSELKGKNKSLFLICFWKKKKKKLRFETLLLH